MPQVKRVIAKYAASKLKDEFIEKVELANDTGNFGPLIRDRNDFFDSLMDLAIDSSDPRDTINSFEDAIYDIESKRVREDYIDALRGNYFQLFGHR